MSEDFLQDNLHGPQSTGIKEFYARKEREVLDQETVTRREVERIIHEVMLHDFRLVGASGRGMDWIVDFPPPPTTQQSTGVIYPWIGQLLDTSDNQYNAWFGDTSDIGTAAKPLKCFLASVFDQSDSNASQMFLSVGNPTSTNDKLLFQYGGGALQFKWIDSDGSGNPEIWMQQADTAQFKLTANELIFTDESGDQLTDLSVGELQLGITTGQRSDLTDADLLFFDSDNVQQTDISAGEILLGDESGVNSHWTKDDLTFDNDGDSTDISAGEIDLSGADAVLKVGSTQLSEDLLTMGATGDTEYADDHIKLPDGASLAVGGDTLTVQTINYLGTDGFYEITGLFKEVSGPADAGDAIWDMIKDAVYACLDSLSGTLTCNSDGSPGGTVTFTYNQ